MIKQQKSPYNFLIIFFIDLEEVIKHLIKDNFETENWGCVRYFEGGISSSVIEFYHEDILEFSEGWTQLNVHPHRCRLIPRETNSQVSQTRRIKIISFSLGKKWASPSKYGWRKGRRKTDHVQTAPTNCISQNSTFSPQNGTCLKTTQGINFVWKENK